MYRHLIALMLAVWSIGVGATWQISNDVWLGKSFYSLVNASADGESKIYLSSTDTESIQLKINVPLSTVAKDKDSIPFSLKGDIYFDGVKYDTFTLKNGLNVHRFQGVEYEFPDYLFDADFYEKMKMSQTIEFVYPAKARGWNGHGLEKSTAANKQQHRSKFLLGDYYKYFNQFVTYRMKIFIPEFLEREQKTQYANMIESCIDYASHQVVDIEGKNKGVSLEERIDTIKKGQSKNKDNEISRVIASYDYLADISKPDWLLYSLFSNCFNRQVHLFN